MRWSRWRFGWGAVALGSVLLLGVVVWFWGGFTAPDPVAVLAPPALPAPMAAPVWDPQTVTQMESEVLSALQCRATQQHGGILVHDPALRASAMEALAHLQADATTTPAAILDSYGWWALGVIGDRVRADPATCGWADFDLVALDLTDVQAVGVAVAPPVGYSPATVVVIGRRYP